MNSDDKRGRVTITLYVDTQKFYEDPSQPIDGCCHFDQVGGTKRTGKGLNEEFTTVANLKDYKEIAWVGVSSSKPAFGDVQILAIVSETSADVFSSFKSSGNPQIVVGTLEKKTENKNGDGEPYIILFQLRGLGQPMNICRIDPKLEINP